MLVIVNFGRKNDVLVGRCFMVDEDERGGKKS